MQMTRLFCLTNAIRNDFSSVLMLASVATILLVPRFHVNTLTYTCLPLE